MIEYLNRENQQASQLFPLSTVFSEHQTILLDLEKRVRNEQINNQSIPPGEKKSMKLEDKDSIDPTGIAKIEDEDSIDPPGSAKILSD